MASFAVMVIVGSMYGLTAILVLLPSDGVDSEAPVTAALFGAVCLGLAVGTWSCGSLLANGSPRTVGTAGAVIWALATVAMGRSLASGEWRVATIAALVGGLGVGLSYLTVVTVVGPAFPGRPGAAAAIGPLGFAVGTVSYCLAGALLLSSISGAPAVGNLMATVGTVSVAFALLGLWLPSTLQHPLVQADDPLRREDKALLAGLLFVNALPGMLMLSVAVPLLQHYEPQLSYAADLRLLGLSMSGLLLGGVLSPPLRKRLGTRRLFVALLTLRGVLLVTLPSTSSGGYLLMVFAVVLFGHGAGFALLPGVTKSKTAASRFTQDYGTILVSWGAAGAFAVSITLLSWHRFEGPAFALATAGLLALAAAALLLPARGARLLDA